MRPFLTLLRCALDVVAGAEQLDPADVVRAVNAEMLRALRVVSVERGHDPRDFALVAFGGARLMKSLLYGVSTSDPITFACVALLLLGIALLACWVPARRASRVEPMIALRAE